MKVLVQLRIDHDMEIKVVEVLESLRPEALRAIVPRKNPFPISLVGRELKYR